MAVKLLTLSSSGTLEFPQQIIDRLFLYFIHSSKKQSRLYKDNVVSYKYIEHMHGDDKETFASEITESLKVMYGRYFTDVDIDVEFIEQEDNLLNAIISGTMIYAGTTYTLEKRLTN